MQLRVSFTFFLFSTVLAACGAVSAMPRTVVPSAEPILTGTTVIPSSEEVGSKNDVSQILDLALIPTPLPRRLWAGELQLAADVDDIPAIFAEDDFFVNLEDGSREWSDEEMVIGLAINGDVRAYPVRILSNHEIVNDMVGGQPVAVTWCPLCFSAITFDRVVDGKVHTFGVSGFLYYNNLVMYDHRTNTLWSQMLAQGIKGAQRGQFLAILPSFMSSWGEWKTSHPDTRVLSAVQMGNDIDIVDPYVGYYGSGSAGITGWANPNELLGPKELVVGLVAGASARAYPSQLLQELLVINDSLDNFPVLISFDEGHGTTHAYHAQVAGQILSFIPGPEPGMMVDEQSGSIWRIGPGIAIEGPLEGEHLERVAAPLVFWFAWSDIHTNSDVYAAGPEEGNID